MSLSVCLIVKDEEAVIARCLNCAAKFADEIIVVDTGSSDGTVAEVKKFTDEVYFYKWNDDFSAARNFSLEKAGCDFVMWLDADDVISDENCKKIRELVEKGGFDMAFLPYAAAFDGDKPSFTYYRERIFRRSKNYRFSGAVHEAVTPCGNIVYSSAVVEHRKVKSGEPLRNLRIYQSKLAQGETLDARAKFYYGRELLFNGMYLESIAVLEDFLRGDGWVENKIEACFNLNRAYSAVGETEKARMSLLRSLDYAPPRSEFCCLTGEFFIKKGEYENAAYWYKTALNCRDESKKGGFCNADYCGFIPNMQLCVIYDKLGDYKTAYDYNEAAGAIKPRDGRYLYNKNYFENKFKENNK